MAYKKYSHEQDVKGLKAMNRLLKDITTLVQEKGIPYKNSDTGEIEYLVPFKRQIQNDKED